MLRWEQDLDLSVNRRLFTIDNACGASPATLHLFEGRVKPRRNIGMQAHVDITQKRFQKRLKVAWIDIYDSMAQTRHMAEMEAQQREQQVLPMSTLLR